MGKMKENEKIKEKGKDEGGNENKEGMRIMRE